MINIIDLMDIKTSIVSLYEASLLGDIEDTLKTGDDYFGENSFPKRTDIKKLDTVLGNRYSWQFPGFKEIYGKDIVNWAKYKAIPTLEVSRNIDLLKGIGIHVTRKNSEGKYAVQVYLEGIPRGPWTELGYIIDKLEGLYSNRNDAVKAAYDFLCKIKDDKTFLPKVLDVVRSGKRYSI